MAPEKQSERSKGKGTTHVLKRILNRIVGQEYRTFPNRQKPDSNTFLVGTVLSIWGSIYWHILANW